MEDECRNPDRKEEHRDNKYRENLAALDKLVQVAIRYSVYLGCVHCPRGRTGLPLRLVWVQL